MSLVSSLIPIYFNLEIPLGRILEPPHPQFFQLSLSIEPYKYKIISIIEGGEHNRYCYVVELTTQSKSLENIESKLELMEMKCLPCGGDFQH